MKTTLRLHLLVAIQSALVTTVPDVVCAQDAPPDGYVTRREYEELKAQMLAMKKELDAIKKEKEAAPKQDKAGNRAVVDVHKQVAPEAPPEVPLPAVQPEGLLGTTKFLL